MPAISGYQCDGPKCETMAEKNPPVGWMRLVLPASVPVMDQGGGRNDERESTLYLHSNKCLARLSKERYAAAVEAGRETRPGRATKRGDE